MKIIDLLPAGIFKLIEISKRFKSIGLPLSYAFSREKRFNIDMSMIDYLPHKAINKIKTVVDVGANLGHWTNSIYSLLNPNVIICYEPVFDTFELLKKNVKGKKIDCRRSAVGSFNGSVKINVEKKHQMSSILEIHESTKKLYGMQSKTKSEEAKIVKLDDDLKDIKEISLLKIDVQGYEKQVLEGARNILKVTNMLIVEILYVSHYKKDYCAIDLMKEITEKYDFNLWVVTPANKDNNNRPIFADAIFIKKGIDA